MRLGKLRAGGSLIDTSVVTHNDLGLYTTQMSLTHTPRELGVTQRFGSSALISLCASVFHNITYLVHCWKGNELVVLWKESNIVPGTCDFPSYPFPSY